MGADAAGTAGGAAAGSVLAAVPAGAAVGCVSTTTGVSAPWVGAAASGEATERGTLCAGCPATGVLLCCAAELPACLLT